MKKAFYFTLGAALFLTAVYRGTAVWLPAWIAGAYYLAKAIQPTEEA